MNFWQLINYIKSNGCSINLYKRSELVVSQCAGTFDIDKNGKPLICLAINDCNKKELLSILLHEYAHYLQWKDGLLFYLEGEDLTQGWNILDRWLRKIEKYSQSQIKKATRSVVLIEYDADLRVIELSKQLNVDIGSHKKYMANAYSYVSMIKWSAKYRKWGQHPDGHFFKGKVKTPREILNGLTKKEEKLLSLFMN